MKFTRVFSRENTPVENQITWVKRTVHMTDKDGSVVFHQDDVEVPDTWSQTATDILAQKYFRKAGLYSRTKRVEEKGFPNWLWRSKPLDDYSDDHPISEGSAKQIFHRLAGAWTYWGWKNGYFTLPASYSHPFSEEQENAQIFYDEIYLMLARQLAAPNSPQWFNTGLHWAYGIEGSDSGQWICDDRIPKRIFDSYSRPQVHACYIQPVNDDLVGPGGLMDLVVREARLFKHGSGTGTNFSCIRAKGEPLSGGGTSSGLMSFLRVGDRAAGAIKSGGTTRRAAKMVCLDLDHPEIEDFINWKVNEELKAEYLTKHEYSEDEALETVSGQNSNNSVRVTNYFLECVDEDDPWALINITDGSHARDIQARNLWQQICYAAWTSADPGVQFHDTINSWHTCPNDGEINASNPCSEYMFLDNTACNLASLNLCGFLSSNGDFNKSHFDHAVRIWTVILDISVSMASFPSAEIALGTYNYRTLGLGYANLGALLMRKGLAYDSDEGRKLASDITFNMHYSAYNTSNEIANELGTFPRWEKNQDPMREILRSHDIIPHSTGYRNAQVTLLAPTGTIAIIMDCDTTGIEPAFSLKTHKKLAGGGFIDHVNLSVHHALITLGYNDKECADIKTYIGQFGNVHLCPYLKPEHLPVFATAVGPNSLSPEAHVKMVAAVQPYLSGGVSKTVNMPHESTIQDVDKIYRLAHGLGLKSIAIYRDGCKLAQPLTSQTDAPPLNQNINFTTSKVEGATSYQYFTEVGTIDSSIFRNIRKSLPPRRNGYTQKFKINSQSLYLRTGEYEDGSLGEIFINLAKSGSTLRSFGDAFAIAVSIGLQYGVPLSEFVDAFEHMRFEPSGFVQGHISLKICSSILDAVFKDLRISYLQTKEENVLKESPDWINTAALYAFTGQFCLCGAEMIRDGTCFTCPSCGEKSGGCG